MTPEQAYEWLAPKLSADERKALDVVYANSGHKMPIREGKGKATT